MWVAGLKVWGWVKRIPVLFAHFPAPALLLVAIAIGSGIGVGTWLSGKWHAATLADLRVQIADERAGYEQRRREAAEQREANIAGGFAMQRAVDLENQKAWRASFAMLAESDDDKSALAALNRSIERLHNDPAFECRRRPLPPDYLDGVHLPTWEAAAAAAGRQP
jgi:hypothetical protein